MSRSCNTRADYLSKCCNSDDWSINKECFKKLDKAWGPHSIDRFASNYNTKCDRFNSRWLCHGTEAVNAFSQSWRGEHSWLVLPPKQICKVINKMKVERANGTLVVPMWKLAPFFAYAKTEKVSSNKNIFLILTQWPVVEGIMDFFFHFL